MNNSADLIPPPRKVLQDLNNIDVSTKNFWYRVLIIVRQLHEISIPCVEIILEDIS